MRRIRSGGPYEEQVGYCRAVVAGGWVHVAGTTDRPDPETGKLAASVSAQCAGALAIIEQALSDAGASFADIVRVNYYLPDIDEFESCWPHLRAAFGHNPPAATVIEAALITPDHLIEIEVTAYIGD